jgi:hypothetical protein
MPNFKYIIPGTAPAVVVADAMGDTTFWPDGLAMERHRQRVRQFQSYLERQQQQQQSRQPPSLSSPTPTSQNQNVPPSPYSTTTTASSTDQMSYSQSPSEPTKAGGMNNSWGISEDTIPKIVELRRLLYRHNIPNPDIIIQGAKHFCIQGDNSFLEEKLAYLRSVDTITPPPPQQQQAQQIGQDNFVV